MKSHTPRYKHLFRTTKDFKGKVAIAELRRAHVIIVLLSLSLTFLLAAAQAPLGLNQPLVIVIAVLLVFNALISAIIAAVIGKQ